MAKRRGRPPKHTEKDIADLIAQCEQYIAETNIPSVAEFAYKAGVWKSYLYDRAEFSDVLKRLSAKREAAIERGLFAGAIPPAAGIFALKQGEIGWSDRTEVTSTINATVQQIAKLTPEEKQEGLDVLVRQLYPNGVPSIPAVVGVPYD
ncbi:hypothetical protein [Cohnella yongneupensis]|uniref:Terminase small subunit n=1 Tax=Cohnella yongneupensis TaxID=425006 RepID=A0ABW0R618_9BACL